MKAGWWWIGVALTLGACEDATPDPGRQGTDQGPIGGAGGVGAGGAGAEGGAGGAGGDGAAGGAGGAGAAGGAGGAGAEGGGAGEGGAGGGPMREIRDCLDLCGVFRACDRADLFDGDLDTCANLCAEARTWPDYPSWRTCLSTTACDALETCPRPEPPPPTCSEICATVAACGPGDWPEIDVADCPSTCADGQAAERIVRCAQTAGLAPGACNTVAFARCSYTATRPDCVAACDARAACGALDLPSCVSACADPADGAAANRKREHDACLAQAADCDAVTACDTARAPSPQATAICAADAACGQFPADRCSTALDPILASLRPDAQACFEERLLGCGLDVLQCFRPDLDRDPTNACARGCRDRAACGLLFLIEDEAACIADCEAGVDDPAARARNTQTRLCAGQATCQDLRRCLDGAEPFVICPTRCQAQAECLGRIDNIQTCSDDCETHWLSERIQAFSACQRIAGDCAAVDRCFTRPTSDCARLCEAFDDCPGGPADCQTWCDTQTWLDPAWYPTMVACVWGSARCEDRLTCLRDPSAGNACAAWCRSEACQTDAAQHGRCAYRCGADGIGYIGGVIFAQVEDCLAGFGADTPCDNLPNTQCGLPRLSDSYCPLVCQAVERCRPGGGGAACLAECSDRALDDRVFMPIASDVLRAQRRHEGCPALLEIWDRR